MIYKNTTLAETSWYGWTRTQSWSKTLRKINTNKKQAIKLSIRQVTQSLTGIVALDIISILLLTSSIKKFKINLTSSWKITLVEHFSDLLLTAANEPRREPRAGDRMPCGRPSQGRTRWCGCPGRSSPRWRAGLRDHHGHLRKMMPIGR